MDDDGVITPSEIPRFSSLSVPLREVPALDRPNQDPVLRVWRLLEGSPAPGDSRMYLDTKALQHMLDVAKSSPTGRAVIHAVVVDVELREAGNGHRYQVLKFDGEAAPEWSGVSRNLVTRAGG